MFTPLMASAAGYAATAYFYNLGRFKFDAEQRQDCIYQIQNMRLAQWGLFREDVRDVFTLSQTNMDNYILVGALIVTAVMNFIFVGYPAFPQEPRWLLLLWNNCVFACITFGLVSVWLALHGSIAQRSARVKILTQAVRPPVPSLKEIQEAMRAQENFEGGGARRYFEPPAFLVPMAEAQDEVPKPSGPVSTARTVPAHRRPRAKGKSKAEAADWLSDAPYAGEEVLKHLETVDNGGPGRSAVMYSHFWMLRRVQRGYACFDAYSRISLAVAAQQMLLVCAYYSLGHFMSKMDHWPTRAQNPGAAWLSLAASVFASTTLFKLDLFCGWRYRYLMMFNLLAPTVLAGLAIHLAAARTNHGKGGVRPCDQVIPAWLPWFLAVFACIGHMCWIFLIQRVAAPLIDGSSGLPLSFRSTIYLDVFGWHSRHFSAAAVLNAVDCAHHWENSEKMLYETMDKHRPDNKYLVIAHQEAKRISKILARVTQPEVACHFTREEQDDLQQLKYTVEDYVHELESQMSLPIREELKSTAPAWFQCTCVEGASEEVYWVDCRSAQVSWSVPEVGQIIDLVRLSQSLDELEVRHASQSPKTFQEAAVAAESLPFELMPENPDVEVSSSKLPWRCMRWTCRAQLGVWMFTVLVILFDPRYYDSAIAPRETYDKVALWKVQTDWPHEYFRPSALACDTQRKLMLGDQFAIYAADLELIGDRAENSVEDVTGKSNSKGVKYLRTVTLEPMMLTSELDHSWRSFGFLRKKGKLLLLQQDGTQVDEYSLRGHQYVKTWTLSNSLPHKKLEAIQAVEGDDAKECAKESSGFVNAGWLVYAATDSGQVVTLCPTFRNELHPLLMVISLRRRKVAKDVVEVVDSHTGTTKASSSKIIAVVRDPSTGWFWLLNTNTEGMAEVTAWDIEKEKNTEVGRWALPSGRWWVPGMCYLGHNQGFLLAAAADTNRVGQVGGPEIWRLAPAKVKSEGG